MNGQIHIKVGLFFLHELNKLLQILLRILLFQAGSFVFGFRDCLRYFFLIKRVLLPCSGCRPGGKNLIKNARLFDPIKAKCECKECKSEIRREGRVISRILSKDDVYNLTQTMEAVFESLKGQITEIMQLVAKKKNKN